VVQVRARARPITNDSNVSRSPGMRSAAVAIAAQVATRKIDNSAMLERRRTAYPGDHRVRPYSAQTAMRNGDHARGAMMR
jgi:hypothetical protein